MKLMFTCKILIIWDAKTILWQFRTDSITSITPMAERKSADKAFLYREFIISPIPLIMPVIVSTTYLVNFDKMLKILVNAFLSLLDSDFSSSL